MWSAMRVPATLLPTSFPTPVPVASSVTWKTATPRAEFEIPEHTPVSLSELRTAINVLAAGWSAATVRAIAPSVRTMVLSAMPSLRILTPPRVELTPVTYAPAHLSDQISPSHLVARRPDQPNPRYARKRARLDPRSAHLRHRHQRPLLLDRHLLCRRDEPLGVDLSRPVSEVVTREDLRCLRRPRHALPRFRRRSRARALARRSPVSDDRSIDHALHAWRRRQPDARAPFCEGRAVHGRIGPAHEHRHRRRRPDPRLRRRCGRLECAQRDVAPGRVRGGGLRRPDQHGRGRLQSRTGIP